MELLEWVSVAAALSSIVPTALRAAQTWRQRRRSLLIERAQAVVNNPATSEPTRSLVRAAIEGGQLEVLVAALDDD